ncbi:MAG: DUF3365 domain-containing protein [Gemmatimonadota bacterium]
MQPMPGRPGQRSRWHPADVIPASATPFLLLTAALLLACGPPAPEATVAVALAGSERGPAGDSVPVPVRAVEEARSTADSLGSRLMTRLRAALQEDDAAGAVRVCADSAPVFTAELQRPERTVRRVSLRWRTPRDAPDTFERTALEGMTATLAQGGEPAEVLRVEDGPDGRWLRMLRPIRAVPMCLQCHGPADSLDPAVRAVLAERYPDDQATGHADGDLRGAFSVRVRLPGAD